MGSPLRIGIDCTNIRGGGGLTIVLEFLKRFRPHDYGCTSMFVWCSSQVGQQIRLANSEVDVRYIEALDSTAAQRFLWRLYTFPNIARRYLDVLLIPGGLPVVQGIKNISMSLNLLPFMPHEYRRDNSIRHEVIYRILAYTNYRSLAKADGCIFLNQHARDIVFGHKFKDSPFALCPLGVDKRFFNPKREIRPNSSISREAPFKFIYVSTVNGYKHQWHVANAVADLREMGVPIEIQFIGGAYKSAEERLKRTIQQRGGIHSGSKYLGKLPYEDLHEVYNGADGFVFASTCENMPNICLEAMASALPVASSDREPMLSLLGDCAVFFDAERPDSIAHALLKLVNDEGLRNRLSASAISCAQHYDWGSFYHQCMEFIQSVSRGR